MLSITELYYFSPTGGTKRTAEIFCAGLAEEVVAVNITGKELPNPSGEVVVVAAPVFGGRIPAIVAERLKVLNGNGRKAVTLVVYGNRAYEDALLELNNIMNECGFTVIASAALVARHSIVPEVGAGRPDEADKAEIHNFAQKVLDKLQNAGNCQVEGPGNYPYKERMGKSGTPASTSGCNDCGACTAICPTGAIQIAGGEVVTDSEKCILCMACVSKCPEKARCLPMPMQEAMNQKLGALKTIRAANEYFL